MATDNRSVHATSLARRLATATAVVGVLGLVSLPPEHIHLISEHGEHAEVVHRHLAPHHHTDSPTSFDHDDGDEQFLDSSFTIPLFTHVGAPSAIDLPVVVLPAPRLPRSWVLTPLYARVHDPPWRSSLGLRAPPPARLA